MKDRKKGPSDLMPWILSTEDDSPGAEQRKIGKEMLNWTKIGYYDIHGNQSFKMTN